MIRAIHVLKPGVLIEPLSVRDSCNTCCEIRCVYFPVTLLISTQQFKIYDII